MFTPTTTLTKTATALSVRALAVTIAALVLTCAGTSTTGAITAHASAPVTVAPPAVDVLDEPAQTVITGGDLETRVMMRDVMDLYTAAGLHLPNLRIFAHDTDEGCNGHQGLFHNGGDFYRIDLCTWSPVTFGHELAHAWEHHNVDDTTRSDFMARMGVDRWQDMDASAPARAIEQAADVIRWGVQGRPIQQHLATSHENELNTYELLTGLASPRIAHWDDPQPETTVLPEALAAVAAAGTQSRLG
jgi:hypothetical protein